MSPSEVYRVLVLSGAKHDYMPLGLARHARFEVVGVADDDGVPNWLHTRNQGLAERLGVPYLRDVEKAIRELQPQVACVTSTARSSPSSTDSTGRPVPDSVAGSAPSPSSTTFVPER